MNQVKGIVLFLLAQIMSSSVIGQVEVKGTVKDSNGTAIEGVSVVIKDSGVFDITDAQGTFNLENIEPGNYTFNISHLGYKPLNEVISVQDENVSFSFTLEDDLLNLETVVVTGTFEPRTQLQSSTSVTSLDSKALHQIVPKGTADLLQNIPGTFTDGSAGEVFTRVYTRGVSASAEDDLGWYYVSLQEDGLPVSLVQHSYYSPDIFHRFDITTKRVEAIRGGNAAITALNAPGGIYNFISHDIQETLGGEIQLQSGVQGEGNPMHRVDARVGGPLGNNWFLNAGGHYRYDEGARNSDFAFSEGGQFKLNVIKKNSLGYFKFYGKLLDDYTNRWTGVAATNWNDPQAAFGQDFNSTSLLMPSFSANIPDGRDVNNGTTNSFDPSKGVHAKDFAYGLDLLQNLGNGWSIRNNAKFSNKDANWNTSISNAFVSLNDPTAYFISDTSGSTFPIGQVVFRDAKSGSELTRVNNENIIDDEFNFTGLPVEYLSDSRLPNDAIMGTSAWYKQNETTEWMDRLTIRKQWENHDFSTGIDLGFSDTSLFTQGSFGYVTYEPSPRMLQVTVENPGQPVLALSDANGVSNYGGLFYINAEAEVSQFAAFMNDRWKVSEEIDLDLGVRYESIGHKGKKDRYETIAQSGGVDGDINTAYDNALRVPTGEEDVFDYTFNYVSYSVGINYKINNEATLFARFSEGNKAPELNYYFNNFDNVAINQKGDIQKINQAELGIKWILKDFSFTSTAFWSQLKNISVTNFEFDGDTNSIFYTPNQSNASRTIGLEWESVYAPFENLAFRFNGVIQNPKATDWTVYDAAGSVDTADDSTQDFSGNQLPFNPKLMFKLSTEYQKDKISAFFKWQFMGKREGNVANAFQLPAYSTFNLGTGYAFNKHLSANLLVTNLFNSEGLANFFGANSFGANANGATAEFIQANPDASFVVVPVLPRATVLKLNYIF